MILYSVMKQNDLIEENNQRFQELHFSNFLQSQTQYLRFNRLKLVNYERERDLEPWTDAQNYFNPNTEKNSLFRPQPQQTIAKKLRAESKLKMKKQVQDMQPSFKLNKTYVQFGLKFKLKSYKQAKNGIIKSRSNQLRSACSQQRAESIKKQSEQQSTSKTPKMKFLQRKFRIREGTSNGIRFQHPKTDRALNKTGVSEEAQKNDTIFTENLSTEQYKHSKLRPIHSRETRFRWFA